MVKLLYFAEFKLITKKERESINLGKKKTINELIHTLIEKYPKMEQLLLSNHSKKLKNSISISVNHSVIHKNKLLSYKLNEDDVIAFLLPVSGG
ncbi:MAG: MoaD/ThiS family protein [Promethearchaeota archaeon]|nr:MAG: MoaD/ThiS family protein [Candidatus Lokiarchaeota archaeon]